MSEEKKNPYDYVSGSRVAVDLENTQINKFHTKGGTGFAAEEANTMADRARGMKVEQSGTDNTLNGADRVSNGVPIQTKYFENAGRTVNSAFGDDGLYRYGKQLLEVPADQYEDSLQLMREKIAAGKVPGVDDPALAESIVKKGDVTYKQARNIARAGNIDSLAFDAKQQAVTTSYAFAISFAINFAKARWDGKPYKEAVKESVTMGFLSGAASFITGVATSQLLRTHAAAAWVPVARAGVKVAAGTGLGRAAINNLAAYSTGKAIYGAAAQNHVAKLLRTNVATSVVTTAVISAPDLYRAAFKRNVSWAQFSKNLLVNGAGVAGGAGGWMAGAAAGAAVGSALPVVGTVAGGFVGAIMGSLAGGTAATKASKLLMDGLIVDDAKEMLEMLPDLLEPLATDYLLSQAEADEFSGAVRKKLTPDFLREMYKSTTRAAFVYAQFEADCQAVIAKRERIEVPKAADVQEALTEAQEAALAAEEQEARAAQADPAPDVPNSHLTAVQLMQRRRAQAATQQTEEAAAPAAEEADPAAQPGPVAAEAPQEKLFDLRGMFDKVNLEMRARRQGNNTAL
ncbi:hypothetical protein [Variovorax sp. Sphag1AA]|uniref:hypothetical protein n=1 Tax=Variovorax sp. Sphag1AA TaxID=2587027 RepID=UPI00161C8B7C|nr:hypothetical protein [Variovorax sp. Sphag1AA]MBB3182282.1 gas vesicle protein [Variovorax sp. Sphag1AA]